MVHKGNIVTLDESIRKGSSKRALDSKFAHIPGLLNGIKKTIEGIFQAYITQLLETTDDAFFDLAENAPNSAQQNIFFDAMRDTRLKRVDVANDFGTRVCRLLTYSVCAKGRLEFDVVSGLTRSSLSQTDIGDKGDARERGSLDHLSLMDDDSMETMVAVENMAKKFDVANSTALILLDARFVKIAGVTVADQNANRALNPIAPKTICLAFADSCEQLNADIQARIVLYKLFEKHMPKCFAEVYRVVNEHFVRANVLPHITVQTVNERRSSVVKAVPAASAVSSMTGDAESAELLGTLNANAYLPLINSRDHDLYSPELAHCIAMIPAAETTGLNRSVLLDYIHHAQCQSPLASNGAAQQLTPMSPEQVISAVMQTIKNARGAPASLSTSDRDVIGLVSILFKFIIDDRVVAEPMKAAISRMQLPIIKVALSEGSFFNDAEHPARQLLNAMTDATQGWIPNDDWQNDPLYLAITESVDRVIAEFEHDLQTFREVHADLKQRLQQETKRVALREKRVVDVESSRDQQAASRAYISTLVDGYVEVGTPEFIEDMLRDAWNNWLYIIYHREGEGSAAWQDAIDTVRELLWTVAPGRYAAHRHEILSLLPDVIKQLRTGFDAISYDRQIVAAFFYQLEKMHLDILERVNPIELLDILERESCSSDRASTSGHEPSCDKDPHSENNRINDNTSEISISPDTLAQDEFTSDESAQGDMAQKNSGAQRDVENVDEHDVNESGVECDEAQETVPQQGDFFASLVARAKELSVGQWIELNNNDGKKMRCRLVAILRNSGSRIFVNRSGVKAAELSVGDIAGQLQDNSMTLLEDARLFDRALTSIIDNLRARKKSAQV